MSKKNRTGYVTSPTNINAANHLSYLFQVSRKKRNMKENMFIYILDSTYSFINNSGF